MNIKEALELARAKLEDPKCWTQGVLARDHFNMPVQPSSVEAERWCLIGALHAVTPEQTVDGLGAHLSRTLLAMGYDSRGGLCSTWNDNQHRTHQDILRFLDEAISTAPVE